MSDPAITPAAETTTTSSLPDFAAFEASENKRELGGEWPDPVKVTTSEPETKADASVTTTAQTETVPGAVTTTAQTDKSYTAPKPGSKRTQRDQDHINDRIRQSVSEATAALQTENAALKAAKPAAVSESVKAEPVNAVDDPKDPEPVETDFDTYPAFVRASAKWAIREAKREEKAEAEKAEATTRQTERQQETQARIDTWVERRDAFIEAHPHRLDALSGFLGALTAGTPMGDAIMDSDVGPELADYLEQHPQEAERIARLSPVSAIRALGKLESQFSPTTSASASAGPAAKLVTSAPAPPTTLAARSAAPADPVAVAVARGDFSAFEAEENRKAVGASR